VWKQGRILGLVNDFRHKLQSSVSSLSFSVLFAILGDIIALLEPWIDVILFKEVNGDVRGAVILIIITEKSICH
jgi:hypothetical protein